MSDFMSAHFLAIAVEAVIGEGFGEVGWWGLGGSECVLASLDGDGAVTPR
jgi:hypothetical protein